jgi:hypothetical protein
VQVVTKKENGTRYIGEARGTWGKVWESGPEVCSRVRESVAECKRAQQSTRECSRVRESVAERG